MQNEIKKCQFILGFCLLVPNRVASIYLILCIESKLFDLCIEARTSEGRFLKAVLMKAPPNNQFKIGGIFLAVMCTIVYQGKSPSVF